MHRSIAAQDNRPQDTLRPNHQSHEEDPIPERNALFRAERHVLRKPPGLCGAFRNTRHLPPGHIKQRKLIRRARQRPRYRPSYSARAA